MELANKPIKNIAVCGQIAPNLKANVSAQDVALAIKSFANLGKDSKNILSAKLISEFAHKR